MWAGNTPRPLPDKPRIPDISLHTSSPLARSSDLLSKLEVEGLLRSPDQQVMARAHGSFRDYAKRLAKAGEIPAGYQLKRAPEVWNRSDISDALSRIEGAIRARFTTCRAAFAASADEGLFIPELGPLRLSSDRLFSPSERFLFGCAELRERASGEFMHVAFDAPISLPVPHPLATRFCFDRRTGRLSLEPVFSDRAFGAEIERVFRRIENGKFPAPQRGIFPHSLHVMYEYIRKTVPEGSEFHPLFFELDPSAHRLILELETVARAWTFEVELAPSTGEVLAFARPGPTRLHPITFDFSS